MAGLYIADDVIVPSVAGLLRKPSAASVPTRAPCRLASCTHTVEFGALSASEPGVVRFAEAVETASDKPGVGAGVAPAGAASASDAAATAAPMKADDRLTIFS